MSHRLRLSTIAAALVTVCFASLCRANSIQDQVDQYADKAGSMRFFDPQAKDPSARFLGVSVVAPEDTLFNVTDFETDCDAEAKDGDDDWFLKEIVAEFAGHKCSAFAEDKESCEDGARPTPVCWTKSTFWNLPGLEYTRVKDLEDVQMFIGKYGNKLSSVHEWESAPVMIIDELPAFCGLIRDYELIEFPYGIMYMNNGNNGPLSDEPWDFGRNLTVDDRMRGCSIMLNKEVNRMDIVAWLNTPALVAAWVNQRTFVTHHKLRAVPLGVGDAHYDVILSRYGLEDIFDIMNTTAKTKCRRRRHLLTVNHSWFVGRDVAFGEVNRNFGGTIENRWCFLLDDPKKRELAECQAQYRADLLDSRFCLSPRGLGTDTHRHWETLLLGCIPIMEASSLNNQYRGLPAVFVSDYAEITPARLDYEYARLKALGAPGVKRMTLKFWTDAFIASMALDPAGPYTHNLKGLPPKVTYGRAWYRDI